VGVWVIVLLEVTIEQRSGLRVLGAFVLPIVVLLSLKALTTRPAGLAPVLASAWIWIHIALAMVGFSAFVFNFVGAIMYLLQERQLKLKRTGTFYYRLPALETLDRLTFRTLALGFPLPHRRGSCSAPSWARTAWGSALDVRSAGVLLAGGVIIYAGNLAGRAAAGWHGRRAAYFAIFGFAALVLHAGRRAVPAGPARLLMGALRRRPQPQERARRAARAARRRGGQAPRAGWATSRATACCPKWLCSRRATAWQVYGVADAPGEARASRSAISAAIAVSTSGRWSRSSTTHLDGEGRSPTAYRRVAASLDSI